MQRAFALDVLVRPPWGGSLRVLGTVEEPGAVRQTLITVPGVRLDPRWTLLQCSAQYTVQVDELNHGFFELSSTALGLSDEGCLVDCALAKRVRHQKAGNGFHHYDGHVIRCGSRGTSLASRGTYIDGTSWDGCPATNRHQVRRPGSMVTLNAPVGGGAPHAREDNQRGRW
jgi:hypothetical protein